MSLMNDLTQYIGLQQADAEQQNAGYSQLGQMLGQPAKEREDEKRRQENVKKQMSNFETMMQTMNSMPDNSSTARGVGLLDDEKSKDRKGITGISTMIPQKEMSIDETGAVNIKLGMRATTPQEQKAQFEIQKSQMEQQKAEAKSQLLDGYIRGEIQEGAILKEMGSLGLTQQEFDMAAEARDRMRQVSQMQQQAQQQQVSVQQQPVMGQSEPIPQQESSFRFDRKKQLEEQKLVRETQEADKANQIRKEASIDAASTSLSAIDHLLNNINYFGAIEGRMPAGLNTGKREWAKNYDFLESKNILNVLGEMKSQSRTGATGFGALNEKELGIIQNASMRLDKQLDEKTASKYLNEMKTSFEKIIDREKNGYENEQGGQGKPQPNSQPTITREQAISELKRRGKL